MAVEAEIIGLDGLEKALDGIEKKLRRKVLGDVLKKAMVPVREAMRSKAPVLNRRTAKTKTRTVGLLKKKISIRSSKVDKKAGNIGFFVNVTPAKGANAGAKSKTDPFYWRFINKGWTPGNRRKKDKNKKTRTVKVPTYSKPGKKFIQAGAPKLTESLKIVEEEFEKFIRIQNNAS